MVAGLGAFGPGILRELGLLRDQDEFQRQAARRAGYHAYLIGGAATILIVSLLEWNDGAREVSSAWIRLILIVLWASWMFSAVMAYWGAQKTTSRILLTFGSFWALFGIAEAFGESSPTETPAESILGWFALALLVVPWFLLAWTVRRWPRATGVALLALAVVFVVVFRQLGSSPLPMATRVVVATLLLGPFLACGIALLGVGKLGEEAEGRSSETGDEGG